jgi:hypothetical protein
MTDERSESSSQQCGTGSDAGPIRYPENHVVGIVDSPEAATEAVRSLTSGGFLPSEVTVACGPQTADLVRIKMLRTHGGHFVNFMGGLTSERLVP